MQQPTRKTNKPRSAPKKKKRHIHPKYGTSKLEDDFASMFLDKLKVNYIRQYEAKDIKRFYDFYLPDTNLIIEVDGGYYHSDPRIVDTANLSPMQKRNKRVDELKNNWALMHGIPIMRIWEEDIRKSPNRVLKELKERLYLEANHLNLVENKNKRHINKLKNGKKETNTATRTRNRNAQEEQCDVREDKERNANAKRRKHSHIRGSVSGASGHTSTIKKD